MSKDNTQEYRGNGQHDWEVSAREEIHGHVDVVERLRVPGGWLYRSSLVIPDSAPIVRMTFVPMPEAVKHSV